MYNLLALVASCGLDNPTSTCSSTTICTNISSVNPKPLAVSLNAPQRISNPWRGTVFNISHTLDQCLHRSHTSTHPHSRFKNIAASAAYSALPGFCPILEAEKILSVPASTVAAMEIVKRYSDVAAQAQVFWFCRFLPRRWIHSHINSCLCGPLGEGGRTVRAARLLLTCSRSVAHSQR